MRYVAEAGPGTVLVVVSLIKKVLTTDCIAGHWNGPAPNSTDIVPTAAGTGAAGLNNCEQLAPRNVNVAVAPSLSSTSELPPLVQLPISMAPPHAKLAPHVTSALYG